MIFKGGSMKDKRLYKCLNLLFVLFLASSSIYAQSADEIGDLYKKFDWRCVGPAAMGGRTVDLDVVETQPWIIYAAIGPSGVWKTVNNGVIVYLEKGSAWKVADTSYISKLVVSANSKVEGTINADSSTTSADGTVTHIGVVASKK